MQGVLNMWTSLIRKMKHELLFDTVLLPWCVEPTISTSLSTTPHFLRYEPHHLAQS